MMFFICMITACTKQESLNGHKKSSEKNRNKEIAVLNTKMGMAYLKQGDRVRAKQKLLYAQKLAPNSSSVNASMGYFYGGKWR